MNISLIIRTHPEDEERLSLALRFINAAIAKATASANVFFKTKVFGAPSSPIGRIRGSRLQTAPALSSCSAVRPLRCMRGCRAPFQIEAAALVEAAVRSDRVVSLSDLTPSSNSKRWLITLSGTPHSVSAVRAGADLALAQALSGSRSHWFFPGRALSF